MQIYESEQLVIMPNNIYLLFSLTKVHFLKINYVNLYVKFMQIFTYLSSTKINSTYTMNVIKHSLSHTSGLVGLGTQPSFINTFQNSLFFLDFTYHQ